MHSDAAKTVEEKVLYKAFSHFKGKKGQLKLEPGNQVYVTKTTKNGWGLCEDLKTKKKGWCPLNHLEKLDTYIHIKNVLTKYKLHQILCWWWFWLFWMCVNCSETESKETESSAEKQAAVEAIIKEVDEEEKQMFHKSKLQGKKNLLDIIYLSCFMQSNYVFCSSCCKLLTCLLKSTILLPASNHSHPSRTILHFSFSFKI